MTTRIAINGFGRTGRALYRAILERHLDIQIVAINDLGAPEALARLVRRDSVHGRFPGTITVQGDDLVADGHHSRLLREPDVEQLPWKELGVQVVAECTGRHRTRDAAAAHLGAGAERVVVSAPCKEADATFVIGVNDHEFDPERHIVVSNASCTTNCFAPMAKVLQDAFGIESGLMTTVHAYTGDQLLIDGLHKDPRRARSAALNIVPTSTGAARAASLVLPSLEGRFEESRCGCRFRMARSPTSSRFSRGPPRQRRSTRRSSMRPADRSVTSWSTRRSRWSPLMWWGRLLRASSTHRSRWATTGSSRCLVGTTTSGDTPTASPRCACWWVVAGSRYPIGRTGSHGHWFCAARPLVH